MKSKHLTAINETYTEHARHALWIWWQCLVVVVALPIHALIPDVLVKTATRRLDAVNDYRRKREFRKGSQVELRVTAYCYEMSQSVDQMFDQTPPNCS